jgi:ParB/RepB/Spo0J family partition protein
MSKKEEAVENETAAVGVRWDDIPIASIEPNHENRTFEGIRRDDSMKALEASIQEQGLIEPIIVKQVGDDRYEIVAGHRRAFACKNLGKTTIHAIVLADESKAKEIALAENLHRKPPHFLEDAALVGQLMEKYGNDASAVARAVGKSKIWTLRRNALNSLDASIIKSIGDLKKNMSQWSVEAVEEIARLPKDRQIEVCKQLDHLDGLSISEIRRLTMNDALILRNAPWGLEDATLCPSAGSCNACPFRTGANPDLFEDLATKKAGVEDRCLSDKCFGTKMNTHIQNTIDGFKQSHGDCLILSNEFYLTPELLDRFPEVQKDAEFQKSKGKTGTPGVYVDGRNIGRTTWIVPEKATKKTTKKDSDEPKTDAMSGETVEAGSIQEKRSRYDDRRNGLFVDRVRKLMKDRKSWTNSDEIISLNTLISLLFDFGTMNHRGEFDIRSNPLSCDSDYMFSHDPIGDVAATKASKREVRIPTIGRRLTSNDAKMVADADAKKTVESSVEAMIFALSNRLNRFGKAPNKFIVAEAIAWAKFLKAPIKDWLKEISAEVVYAKSWAAEVDDDWATRIQAINIASLFEGKKKEKNKKK